MRKEGLPYLLSALVGATVPFLAQGSELQEVKREYRSGRYLGSGDSGVSTPVGIDAIFYNPAGIADVKGLLNEVSLASPQVMVGRNARSLYYSLMGSKEKLSLDSLLAYSGKPLYAGIQNVTGVAFRRAAFGLLQKAEATAYLGSSLTTGLPVAEAQATGRAGAYFSVGRGFFSESMFLGVTAKYLQKAEAEISMSVLEAENLKSDNLKNLLDSAQTRGTGFGVDLGLLFRNNKAQLKPALGIVAKNIGNTAFTMKPGTISSPTPDYMSLDVGMSVRPGTKKSESKLSIDVHDVTNKNKNSIYKRVHLGAELSFQGVMGGTVGMNQGYPTYGGFVCFKFLRAEAGSYSEELGKFAGDKRDQRYFGRLMLGWTQ